MKHSCGAEAVDCGIENSDKYCPRRHHFYCMACKVNFNIVIGPPRELPVKSNYKEFWLRTLMR
jgi:hypothetical protein